MTTTIAPRIKPDLARPDWWPLVRSTVASVALVLVGKVIGTLAVAAVQGAPWRVATWNGLPYFRVETAPAQFAQVVSWSSLVMVAGIVVASIVAVRRRDLARDVVDGRLLGLVVAAETLGLEVLRHVMAGPVVSWTLVSISLGALFIAAGALIGARARSHPWWELDTEVRLLAAEAEVPELDFDFESALPTAESALFDDSEEPVEDQESVER